MGAMLGTSVGAEAASTGAVEFLSCFLATPSLMSGRRPQEEEKGTWRTPGSGALLRAHVRAGLSRGRRRAAEGKCGARRGRVKEMGTGNQGRLKAMVEHGVYLVRSR